MAPPNLSDKSTTANPPKLLDQVRNKLRVKHYSIRTEQAYSGWIKRFIYFHGKRHPKHPQQPPVSITSSAGNTASVSASTSIGVARRPGSIASLFYGVYTALVLALEVFADFIRKFKREAGVFASYATNPALPPQR